MPVFNEFQLNQAINYLTGLLKKGKSVKVEIVRQIRSLDQNRYYWLIIACVAEETGNDNDIIHELFKASFLPKRKATFSTEEISGSTKKLDTKQFTVYIDKIRLYCSEALNITIPETTDKGFKDFYETYKEFL